MKDVCFYLPNDALEGSGKFCASFFAHINTAFCFYIYVQYVHYK